MANDSSFKIRLDILNIIKDISLEEYRQKCNKVEKDWTAKCETARNQNREIPLMGEIPEAPKIDDIVEKAKVFNKFISGKG